MARRKTIYIYSSYKPSIHQEFGALKKKSHVVLSVDFLKSARKYKVPPERNSLEIFQEVHELWKSSCQIL